MSLNARAANSTELTLFRTEGHWGQYFAAILEPTTVYTAQVNQTFSTTDKIIEVTYDNGSGTLANVLADMTMLVGSTAGARDKGICRVKSIDGTKVYIGETSHINWANNLYLTIIRDWSLWARHVRIVGTTPYMDGTIAYSNQHASFDPVPIMGCHRVLKLTGSTVSTQFNWGSSYCPGSSISSYSVSAPSSSGITGGTTSTPTITFNTVGWHPVYLTVTAANGKSFWGIRWVYVYDNDNLPASVEWPSPPRQSAEAGGWEFEIRLTENVDITTVRERALVVVFGEEYYGTNSGSIGQLAGCENIMVTGWIGGNEEIHWNPLQGSVQFRAYTAQYWLERIPSFPDGVKFITGAPAAWTEIQQLTVDKGLHHFLHWRTTATRVMDVSLTGDTKLTPEVHSIASTLWEQLREIGFLQILARPGVDRFNRLFIQVHPQLVPQASRTWATVMTILKEDLAEEVDFERITVQPNAFVDLSGVAINNAGKGTPYFSLSPGHAYPPYGTPEMLDHLLVESQSQSNTLAGLYRGWLNNELPNIPAKFLANNRMIDCFPRQFCSMEIFAGDTPRGTYYNINLVPKEVSFVPDPSSGRLHTEVIFEAETFADIAINGDVPGNENIDITIPPLPPLPPLPPIDIIVPGTVEATDGGPPKVLLHSGQYGLIYTENFNEEDGTQVQWELVNPGLTQDQYQQINQIILTPSGGIYVAHVRRTGFGTLPFIAYASGIGQTFTIIEDTTTIAAKYPSISPDYISVNSIGLDPLTGQFAYVIGIQGSFGGDKRQVYVGSGVTFAAGMELTSQLTISSDGNLSFGYDEWRLTGTPDNTNVHFYVLNSDGSAIVRDVNAGAARTFHVPIDTSDEVFMWKSNGVIRVTANGAVAGDFTTILGSLLNSVDYWNNQTATDPTGTQLLSDWDTGRRGKSNDGGSSWTGLPSLTFHTDGYAYDYAGGAGTNSHWVAARGVIRCSLDFGNSWLAKDGNIITVAPISGFDIIKAVEY
jgi:hypothetical protein